MSEKNYVIITDSSADLPAALVKQLDIEVLPLTFTIGAENYLNYPDEREMRAADFYATMRDGAVVKTAAVNVDNFLEIMRPHLEAGRDVLYLGFSSGLSATYNSGRLAADELQSEFPERKILTVDTLCASLGQGLLVYLTAQKRNDGASIEEAAAFAEESKLHICHWFTVDDLFFLKRGGRVSATTAIIGSALGIKPVLHVDNEGHLINVAKARGRKNAIAAIAEHMRKEAIDPANQTIFISHGDCLDDAELLAKMLRDTCGFRDVIINYVGPVIGAHSGPGTLALFYYGTVR